MNKTENKTQVDFSNIRDLQNIIKTNGISKLAMGVKSFKQRLSLVSTKITDAKKKSEDDESFEEFDGELGDMTDDAFFRMEYSEFVKYMDKAIDAHQNWLSNLKSMIEKRHAVPLQFDAAKCGFGHFYYSMTPKTPEIKAVWTTVEGMHKKFHEYGKHVKDAIEKGDTATAEKYYRDAENTS